MPRPGYEAEDDAHLDDDDVLNRFDPEIKAELAERLNAGKIGQAQVVQLYRLITQSPEDRDADSIAEMLDTLEGMSSEEFKSWVDDRIERWRDQ